MARRLFSMLLIGLVAGALTAGCGLADHALPMADMAGMPPEVQAAPVNIQQAYQFAAANPDVLRQLPCYCGCDKLGHKSNYDCYVAGAAADGSLIFDIHAVGCGICVNITQDAMRQLRQGKTVPEIKTYIDATYSRFGPSTMP